MRSFKVGAVSMLYLASVAARAAPDPQLGRWTLDVARSRYHSAALPRSSRVSLVPYGRDGVTLSVDAVNAAGATSHIQYSAEYDGKPYPRIETGAGAVAGQMVTLRRVSPRTVERIVYLQGKPVGTERWTISQDGRTRTVVQSGHDAHGKAIDNLQIYVRP